MKAALFFTLLIISVFYSPLSNAFNSTLMDISKISDTKAKKSAFFTVLYEPILNANESILEERQVILDFASGNNIDPVKLLHLKNKYRVATRDEDKAIAQLLLKVDTIPLELALNQAANESGWGGSRFAQRANNLFGIWCFKPGCGIAPKRRPIGKTYEVRKYVDIQKSIEDYMLHLNVGSSYTDFRNIRKGYRDSKRKLSPLKLAEGLEAYSERGDEYVLEIKSMIRYNRAIINNLEGVEIAKN